jgi:phage baseplate assembly protein W
MPLLFLADAGSSILTGGPALPNANVLGVEYVTFANITSADWSLMLDSTAAQDGLATGVGAVVQGFDDVNQCINIILTTPKGSDYLRPTFGCDIWHFLDAPLTLALPHIVREVTESLTIWEPRINVIAVTATLAANGANNNVPGNLVVSVTWQLKLGVNLGPTPLQQNTVIVTITSSLVN